MAKFNYKGTSKGAKVEGSLEAGSRKDAMRLLMARGIQPISLSESGAVSAGPQVQKVKSEGKSKRRFSLGRKPITEPFLAKLLQLHQSGMPLGDAIKALKDRLREPEQRELAQKIWQDLSEGYTFAVALKRFPEIFDNSIIYAIEAGEASGNLAPILQNIVEHLREQAELKKKIYSGLAYPVFIVCVAIAVVGLFLFYLLPRIQSMMQSMGGSMTLSARIMIGMADAVIYVGPVILALIIIGILVIKQMRKKEEGLRKTDAWLLRIPFISTIVKEAVYSQVSNLLATLLGSGVNTTEAMRLTEKIVQNKVLFESFQLSEKQINDGAAMSVAFRQNNFFPDLAIDILAVGENTGDMVHCFKEIYTIYRKELERNLKNLTTFISSIALLFAFLLVSVLAMSIVTSILQFSNSLMR